jgi:hypothetical protein
MIYKVSLVVPGAEHGGAILNLPERPQVGDHLQIGEMEVEVIEVMDLLPPRGNFQYLHATCRAITSSEKQA